MKLNEKGFAISTILYGMLLMAVLILGGLLTSLSSSKRSNDLLIDDVEDYLNKYADEYVKNNPTKGNILAVYKYVEPFCITGEEEACVEIGPQPNYTAGTIIKYRVAPGTIQTFYVMYDNGNTLTMIARDAVGWSAWDASSISTKYYTGLYGYTCNNGPITAVEKLEQATSSWINVIDQEYTIGTTPYAGSTSIHYYRECYWDDSHAIKEEKCYSPSSGHAPKSPFTYSGWPTRTAKSRLISAAEALDLGANRNPRPKWLSNSHTWTMNTFSYLDADDYETEDYSSLGAATFVNGYLGDNNPASSLPIRPVVVIDKDQGNK